jgi:signal transduction histidine kinase
MSEPSAFQLVAAAAYSTPALIWAIIAGDMWSGRVRRRPRNPLTRMLPWLASGPAAFFFLAAVFALLPTELHQRRPPGLLALYIIQESFVVGAVAVTRHLAALMPLGTEAPPRPFWLVVNYGIAAAVMVLSVFPTVIPAATLEQQITVVRGLYLAYIATVLTLSVWRLARTARRGMWRSGSLGDLRSADVLVLIVGVLGSFALFATLVGADVTDWSRPAWLPFLSSMVGLTMATPFAVRTLGIIVRQFSVVTINLAAAGILYLCIRRGAAAAGESFAAVGSLSAAFLPVLLLIPAQPIVREAVNSLFFRPRRVRQAELQAALLQLSPELGVAECCRRALTAFVRIMELRGAGFLLDRDGTAVVAGALDLTPIERVWPRGPAAAALPPTLFGGGALRELPRHLQEALIDADVVGVLPVVSPRQRWGFIFVASSMLRASFTADELESAVGVAGQFALILDAAELLEHALAVERSLAHSERLAAIGELAARVAHEIRNPVTAARSLAQLMVRDPTSPHAAEHADLILAELGRVERQVQALLRFARREEFSFETVDVGELARSALEPFRPRLDSDGVDVAVTIAESVVARADREKLRQVVVNLLENAADALEQAPHKRLALAVSSNNGSAVLEVSDSGSGVPPEALARLFEPFFSLKTTGTGLGLAIVKRTVEAHGGRVEARAQDAGGLAVRVELPAPSPARERAG